MGLKDIDKSDKKRTAEEENRKDKDFYKEHSKFVIYTRDKVLVYEIFAYYDIEEDGDIYHISFEDDNEFERLLEGMVRRRYYDTGVTAGTGDKVITLSTCSGEGERFVIHAKRVRDEA